jgi:hypothetical protein
MSDQTNDFCAAYGCPMLGVYGVSGKWYCACHFNVNPALNDAVTMELHRQKVLVDQIVALRREGCASGKLEGELLDITRQIGAQPPLAPVTGPTHGTPHFSETDA